MQPSLFLSHGAPTLPLTSCPAHDFLAELGLQLKKPKAILVASAHWETATPAVSAVALVTPAFAPQDAPWGERYFHLIDPDGHELSFAKPLA